MRKIINQSLDTVRVRGSRVEASFDSEEKRRVLETHSTAKILALGTAKRVIREKTDLDPPSLVRYVFLSGECSTQDEAWKQALEGIFP